MAIRYGVGAASSSRSTRRRELRERLGALLGPGGAGQLDEAFDFHAVDAGEALEIAGVRFTFLRTDHPIHTLAMRAETAAGTLTYSADTGPGADLAGFARGSDLLALRGQLPGRADGPALPPQRPPGRRHRPPRRGAGAGAHPRLAHASTREVSLREARETAGPACPSAGRAPASASRSAET